MAGNAVLKSGLAGHVLTLVLAHPPVNALGYVLRCQLADALEKAFADPTIRAIVIGGGDALFSAGADVAEFGSPSAFRTPNLTSLIAMLDAAPKPVIAALTGNAIGGGLELALACHYRVGTLKTTIAFPEVHLGLIPGAQGTQRLPRLVGVEAALNIMLSGQPVAIGQLSGGRFLDRIAEGDVLTAAQDFAVGLADKPGKPPRVRDLPLDEAKAEAFLGFARTMIAPQARHLEAPLRLVDALEAAVKKPFDKGAAEELAIFRGLIETPQSRALRHVFFAERMSGKIDGLPADTPKRTIEQVGIVGAGTMGAGIATAFLSAGFAVTLAEMSGEALARGVGSIRKALESGVKRGKITAEAFGATLARLAPVTDLAALSTADLIVEAVFEDMAVKKGLFEKLDALAKPGAILASNTSTLDLDAIAAITKRPGDVVGLHFFSPAHVMRLLEIVRGKATSDDVLATAMELAKRLRKVPVLARVCDGFIGNRMVNAYFEQALLLIEEGASPDQVDKAIEGWGMAMGPFRMSDMAGNDIGWAIRKRHYAEDPGCYQAIIADRLCAAGRFGQKSSAGWYRYPPGARKGENDPFVAALIAACRLERGITPRRIGAEEIVQRLVYALANEGARLLDEGIAQRASDIDVVYVQGYGFPPHRGGPMHLIEEAGIADVIRTMRDFARRNGPDAAFWAPAPLLERAAATGLSLAQLCKGDVA